MRRGGKKFPLRRGAPPKGRGTKKFKIFFKGVLTGIGMFSYGGKVHWVQLDDVEYKYQSNCSINNPTVSSVRMILDLTGISSTVQKTIAVPYTIKALNLKSDDGVTVENLYFYFTKGVTINLYNVSLKAAAGNFLFYNYSSETTIINVLGSNTLFAADNISGSAISPVTLFGELRIETNVAGVLTVKGANGIDGVNGTHGRAGANGRSAGKRSLGQCL